MQAIGMAGGFTKEANVKSVTVMRVENGKQRTIKINTKDIIVRGEKDKDIVVEPGDVISVPEGFSQVSVIGEVKKPGKYDMPHEKIVTLMEAIGLAGGFTKEGDVKNVTVMRVEGSEQKTIKINTKDITERGEKDKDIVIEPGDVISVPECFSEVSVMGEVNKPGKYDMPPEKSMTLLEAIAMAEGFTKDADVTRVKVLRVEGGVKRTIVINTKDITEKDEKEKDIELKTGDIVYVPESFF
jgi:polysaccharide export outer membrane protein